MKKVSKLVLVLRNQPNVLWNGTILMTAEEKSVRLKRFRGESENDSVNSNKSNYRLLRSNTSILQT